MNLAIIRWRIAETGGAERFIFDIAKALDERGVEVTLISEPWERSETFTGRFLELPRSRGSRSARFRGFQNAVADLLARNSFDLVQTHERVLTADLYRAGDGVHAAWFDRLKRSRPWWRGLGMNFDPMHRHYMGTEQKMARDSDMVFVANSPLVARELREWLDIPDGRIRLIENGVDLDRFAPAKAEERDNARRELGLPTDGPVAAYVGSGFERKGAFHLVRAMADPSLRDLAAIIAGRDKAAAALIQLVERLGLSGRVIVPGPVADVRSILHAADLFVLPTLYDPMPNAALEALASGLPVVTTPDAGIAEAITESAAGRVSSREPEALADAIGSVVGDLAATKQSALSLRPRFAFSRSVGEWLDLYGELS